jgi:hypothetical protein
MKHQADFNNGKGHIGTVPSLFMLAQELPDI